jgi:hypothetical protein
MPAIIDGTNGVTTPNVLTSSSGVALTLQSGGTTAVTIDTSQNVLVGLTSAISSFSKTIQIQDSSSAAICTSITGANARNWFTGCNSSGLYSVYDSTAGAYRLNIDSSGNLLVGMTTYGVTNAGASLSPTASSSFYVAGGTALTIGRGTNDGTAVQFNRSGTNCGTISVTTTATAYNTSSDYRLKENIVRMTGALAKVNALKPVNFKWKSDGSDSQGFIAHELADVVPECVTGTKDAIDANGNPIYQGIDTSFLVATLTAAIQELKTIVDAQSAEIAELKAKA